MGKPITIQLGGSEHTIARSRLGGFLALKRANELIKYAVRIDNNAKIADGLYAFLNVAMPELRRETFNVVYWQEIFSAYYAIDAINQIPELEDFAILIQRVAKSGRVEAWHYPGRAPNVWIHIIADAYHWSREEILNLWPEDAVAYIQEIQAEKFRERNFLHSLSRVAYDYDKVSKKSKYIPLAIPTWMMMGIRNRINPIGRVDPKFIPLGKIIKSPAREV